MIYVIQAKVSKYAEVPMLDQSVSVPVYYPRKGLVATRLASHAKVWTDKGIVDRKCRRLVRGGWGSMTPVVVAIDGTDVL